MKQILQTLEEKGFMPLIVGGYVRDKLLGVENKDIDVEVYNISYQELVDVLTAFGKVDLVGQSFGVVKLTTHEKEQYDFSIPRIDSKNGVGHKGFSVETKSDLTPKEAAARRDFTINSMAIDFYGNLIDPWGGENDLKFRVLRHTSEQFSEDALRVLRGFQFCSRFLLTAHENTIKVCQEIIHSYNELPKERVWDEWEKWAAKSFSPSLGLNFLVQTDWVKHYPELDNLIGCPQDSEWHPEGDVFNHTSFVCDSMANICRREKIVGTERKILMFAALCHDMGKPSTTEKIGGRWAAKNHAKVGVEFAESFLSRIGCPNNIVKPVLKLVQEHMFTAGMDKLTDRAIRRLLLRLDGVSVKLLELLIEADKSGRPPIPSQKCSMAVELVERTKDISIKKIVTGFDLLELGLTQGEYLGKVLNKVYQYQIDGRFSTKEEGIKHAKRLLNSGY